MRKSRLINFIIFLPFAASIGAFILYVRYLIKLKSNPNLEVIALLQTAVSRYRNIALFCLAVGVFLLFIKTLYDFLTVDKKEYEEEYECGILDRISSRKRTYTETKTLDESQIVNDLLKDKILRVHFIDSSIKEKIVKFGFYNGDEDYLELINLEKEEPEKIVTKKETIPETRKRDYILSKINAKDFVKCKKCKNLVANDAVMCVHCGTIFKKDRVVTKETTIVKEKTTFNPVRFVLNLIVILLCIILVLLFINKIERQKTINNHNLNIKVVDTK